MQTEGFPTDAVRRALEAIPPTVAQQSTEQPDVRQLYLVWGHERALNPDTTVVVGDRGTGKSFWSAALNGDLTRQLIAQQFRGLRLEALRVSWGFSAAVASPYHPSRRVLRKLLADGFDPEDIWRAVVLRQVETSRATAAEAPSWDERVRAVASSPQWADEVLAKASQELDAQGQRHLIVFDALDRVGNDWREIRRLVRGLLRVCLDLGSMGAVRVKLFMRPDMWDDRLIWAFPDASKLHHGEVVLQWRRADLYGLLWHWLANREESGAAFRRWVQGKHRLKLEQIRIGKTDVYMLPKALRIDEARQERLLGDLASKYMGRDRRRGRTYSWLPNHLGDAKGHVSPRSFLIAIREAEMESRKRGATQVLNWEGIKQGVQQASRIRVEELREDYPWIEQVLAPLHGMTVPCAEAEMHKRWRDANVVKTILAKQAASQDGDADHAAYLAPHALAEDPQGGEVALVTELIRIGVMSRLPDGRLNIPDLFRVAAGIGRKGGVRAIR